MYKHSCPARVDGRETRRPWVCQACQLPGVHRLLSTACFCMHVIVFIKNVLQLLVICCAQVVALEPRYASRKTREFVTGDVRGRLKLSSQVGSREVVVYFQHSPACWVHPAL